MSRFLSTFFCIVWATAAFAQLLPIELDQDITLPYSATTWDVMPHPDGYYLWVEALEQGTEQTRLYWGRSDGGGYEFLDLDVGEPVSVTCFWREDAGYYEPYVMLCSRRYFQSYALYDRTLFRVYRLADGQPDSAQWLFSGDGYRHIFGYFNWDHWNYRPLAVALQPPPPSATGQVTLLVAFSNHSWGSAHGYSSESYSTPCRVVIDMLNDVSGQVVGVPGSGPYGTWTVAGQVIAMAYFGSGTSCGSSWGSPWSCSSSSAVTPLLLTSDSLTALDPAWTCSQPGENTCHAGMLAATYSAINSQLLQLVNYEGNALGMVTSPGSGEPVWTAPAASYNSVFAVDVLGDSNEEFLASRVGLNLYDVLDAADGQYYGQSTNVTGQTSSARVIGRYDPALRRLAMRSGSFLIHLYRFGAYDGNLAAVSLAESGPSRWGYRLQVLNGEISQVVFSPVCPGTTAYVSGPDADQWTVVNAGDSVLFECSPPAMGAVLDTLFLSHPACDSMVHWQAGLSEGTIAGPFRSGLAVQPVETGPPQWAYHLQLYSAVVSRIVFSPLCSGTTASVSGPEADRWTITRNADSVVFESSPPAIVAVLDTFFLSQTACVGTIYWQAGLSHGTIPGPYQPVQVTESGPPHWGYHPEWYGDFSRIVFFHLCPGTTASVAGPEASRWTMTNPGDSLVFESSPPVIGAVLDTFFLSHPTCSGTIYWQVGSNEGTIFGPNQSGHSVSLNAIAATNEEGGVRITFRTTAEHDVADYEIWKAAQASGPFLPVATLESYGDSDSTQSYTWLDENVVWSTFYYYFILDEDIFGWRTEHRSQTVSVLRAPSALPLDYSLDSYPNPFNSVTRIRFTSSRRETIRLTVYNLEGRLVETVTHRQYEPGRYSIPFDGSALPSGIYLVHMVTEKGFVATRKMVLLK